MCDLCVGFQASWLPSFAGEYVSCYLSLSVRAICIPMYSLKASELPAAKSHVRLTLTSVLSPLTWTHPPSRSYGCAVSLSDSDIELQHFTLSHDKLRILYLHR